MRGGFYNIDNNNPFVNNLNRKRSFNNKIYLYENKFYDSIHIVKRINNSYKIKTFNINIKIKENDKSNYKIILDNLDLKILKVLEKYLCNYDSERLTCFLKNTIPELYLISKDRIFLDGLKKVHDENIKYFIRTSYAIVDNDLLKIIASELYRNGTNLYTTFHGGNNYEIAYNSIYKIDETLSKKYLNPKELGSKKGLVRYKPKKFFFKRGIVIYLKERNFQNTFLFGSETYEDQSKYMYDILDLLNKLNYSIKKELIFMRHNDLDKVNLYELFFHIKKSQLYEMNSIQKKFYRKFFKPKLQVSTYTGTVFIESILANIPCVLFFNPKRYELSKEMCSLMEIFKNAKILHSDPESLSKFLKDTKNFYSWWQESLTKEAIKKFTKIMRNYF